MVVVKHGALPPPGKQYKVYLNVDKLKHKWYLRVTHTYPQYNQHFRAGTYKTKEDALKALDNLDPTNPKKGRQRKGTVDQYNGQWRVRAKHRGEHMHVGYFKDREKAEQRLKEVIADTDFLEKRYNSLIAKRKRKRESMKTHSSAVTMASLRTKVKKLQRKQRRGHRDQASERCSRGDVLPFGSLLADSRDPLAVLQPCPPRFDKPTQFVASPFLETTFSEHNPLLQQGQAHGIAYGLIGCERGEGSLCSRKTKVRIRKRCMICAKTQAIETLVYDASSEDRLVYYQCDSCKKLPETPLEPFDVGWCAPAILTDYAERNFREKSEGALQPLEMCSSLLVQPVELFNPHHGHITSPISYD